MLISTAKLYHSYIYLTCLSHFQGCLCIATYCVPTNIYLFSVSNKPTRKRCAICSKLTIKTPERRCSGVFFVNFKHIIFF